MTPRLVATMPVRNEDWILGLSLRALLMWVDAVVVGEHCSTDGTRAIIREVMAEHPGRVLIRIESDPTWEEMRHRQALLDDARSIGGTHIVLCDADEVLTGDLLPTIHEMVYACPPNATMQLPWLCLRGSKDLVHRSGVWGEQNVSMGFMDAPGLGWNAAERGTYDFHQRAPMGRPFSGYRPVAGRESGMLHLQFVSDRRLRAKQALYQATEVIRWPGRETPDQIRKKYSLSVYGADAREKAQPFDLAACPDAWWAPYANLMHHYHPDAEPWQEKALRDLIPHHGYKFVGLDFFGVA